MNSTDCLIIKFPNKRELQQINFNHSSDIHLKDFMNPYKKWTGKPFCFLVIKAAVAWDNILRFRNNLLEYKN